MPLDLPTLQSSILTAFKSTMVMPAAASPEAAQQALAIALAAAINVFVLSANPITVATSGGAGTAVIS